MPSVKYAKPLTKQAKKRRIKFPEAGNERGLRSKKRKRVKS